MAMAFSIDLRAALLKLFPDAFIRKLAKYTGAVKRLPCLTVLARKARSEHIGSSLVRRHR